MGLKELSSGFEVSYSILNLNPYFFKSYSIPESIDELKKRPEAQNLLGIYSSLKNQGLKDTVNQFSGKNFSEFKKSLSDLVIEKISPISSEINRLNKDISFIDKVLTEGGLKAHEISSKKVKKIKEIIGF